MYQDWKVVTLKKSKEPTGGKGHLKQDKVIARAARSGDAVASVEKVGTGNKKTKIIPHMAKKLEDEELGAPTKVSAATSQAIMQGRQKKEWTQAQLAKEINEKQTVVASYENGSAVPDNRILAAMERALGCKIPRAPKGKKKAKKSPADDDDW
eukprot:TRINITY_DN6060_c0_g1_i2.p3 TRINITY_DN6060_c0_g1~~TRINITY_DN6060_c0_g1_i2.p3  ORF type:complete len:153 (+),score=71.45 TRINITY_DN6060_c0_g1_i2:98-556(+)